MKSLEGEHNIMEAANNKFLQHHFLYYHLLLQSDTKSTGCAAIFLSILYCRYSVVKIQSSVQFRNSSKNLFISITHVSLQLSKLYSLYIICQKSISKKDIFSVFFHWKYFFQQSSRFQIAIFLQPFIGHHGSAFEYY